MSAAFHSVDLDTDEDGWHYATCACGWQSGPMLCDEDAADAYGDHIGCVDPARDSEMIHYPNTDKKAE